MADELKQQQQTQEGSGGKPRVFVYGTLKDGEANHRIIKDGGGTLLGPATITGTYVMRDLGWYPCVIRVANGPRGTIHGEVYEVEHELLGVLDVLEGHPNYYARQKVQTDDAEYKGVWLYLLPSGFLDTGTPVEDGNWTRDNG